MDAKARSTWLDPAVVGLGLVLTATSIMRFTVYVDRPLWLDEVWTGMIVTRPTFAEFIRQCLLDANAPLYSVLAALWAQLTGISDRALRSLPALLGCAAPLIALWPRQDIDRATKFTWCALLACWIPGLWYSEEARPYTLALALGVANAVAFGWILRRPSQRAAWTWAGISSLLILAHYFGLILVGIQGLSYLVVHRGRAVRTWAAALAFLPAMAALAVQAHGLIRFSSPQHSWIGRGNPFATILIEISYVPGSLQGMMAALLWFVIAVPAAVYFARSAAEQDTQKDERIPANGPWLVAACSVVALIVAIVLGFLRPMVIPRYLTEFVPGGLLGLALGAVRLTRRWPLGAASFVATFAAFTAIWPINLDPGENTMSWESASNALMASHVKRVVFLFDTPMGGSDSSVSGVGGFFFARAGHPVPVDPGIVPSGQDPNVALLKQAASPGSSIIWIYNPEVHGTDAIRFPPRIDKLDPRWTCRNFAPGKLGVIACSQRDALAQR